MLRLHDVAALGVLGRAAEKRVAIAAAGEALRQRIGALLARPPGAPRR